MSYFNTDIAGVISALSRVTSTSDLNRNRYDGHELHNNPFKNPLSYEMMYINATGFDVTLVARSGLRHRIANRPECQSRMFVFRKTYKCNREQIGELAAFIQNLPDNETVPLELGAFKKCFLAQVDPTKLDRITWNGRAELLFVVDYSVSAEDIADAKTGAYIVNNDVVLSKKSVKNAPPHPFAESTQSVSAFNSIVSDRVDIDSLGIRIEYVCNEGSQGPRYTYIFNQLHKVLPKKDQTKSSGYYVTRTIPVVMCDVEQVGTETTYYRLDQAHELSLYSTAEEAKSGGDRKLMLEAENAQRKQNYLEAEERLTKYKAELEEKAARDASDRQREKVEMEKEIAAFKRKQLDDEQNYKKWQQEAELEKTRIKDQYEEKAQIRKDNTDLIKFLTTVLVGMGSIFLAISKLKST